MAQLYKQYLHIQNINCTYEGMSINNQPIPFPMDRDSHDFHVLFQYNYVLYMETKLHVYQVIL